MVPILPGPLFEVNCPCVPYISLTPKVQSFPPREHLFLHTDIINKPDTSVGHKNYKLLL
jgi:hypothetical protein